MVIGPYVLIDGGGSVFDLEITSIQAKQPSPPLNSYYTTYSLDQDQINAAINTWYSANNDKLVVTITGALDALSFKYRIVLQSADFSTGTDVLTTNKTFTISGLTPGQTYKIKIQGYKLANGTGDYGNSLVKENIYISKFERLGKITSTFEPAVQDTSLTKTEEIIYKDPEPIKYADPIDYSQFKDIGFELQKNKYEVMQASQKKSSRSLASITNLNKDPNVYAVATKVFKTIPVPSLIGTPVTYYSFGTTLILDGSIESAGESGGLGFFVDNFGNTGYFVQVDSTKRSADINSKRRIRLYRVVGGDKTLIVDSQTLPESTLDIVTPGQAYKLDVKVKHNGLAQADIEIYVNGFKIFVQDTLALNPSSQVAMFSSIGTIYFDYVYGFKITQSEYDDSRLYNAYSGQFSKNSLQFILGNKIFNKNDKVEGLWPQVGEIEDFGKIAREIRKVDVIFSDAPSFPIKPSVGVNEFVYVIGHKTDNFKSEIYVINNSGLFTPLSDGNVSLVIYGYNIYKSGTLEYKDEESNEYTKEEPVYFESDWIQNIEDIKKLSKWLKDQWSKSYLVAEVKVFGGILISVGDIVTINYAYHGLTTSQKFLVQSVNHSYSDGGIDTTLTCRLI